MNRLVSIVHSFGKIWRLEILLVFAVSFLTILAWRDLPNAILRGDSFDYFVSYHYPIYWRFPETLYNFGLAARFLGVFLPKIFGVNMAAYYVLELIFIAFTGISFFVLLRILTKSSFLAGAGSLLASVNYFGSWDTFPAGIYAYFKERALPLPFLLISFALLHLSLEKRQRKYLVWAILLFFTGIFLAHWGIMFSAPFVLYPLFWFLFKTRFRTPQVSNLGMNEPGLGNSRRRRASEIRKDTPSLRAWGVFTKKPYVSFKPALVSSLSFAAVSGIFFFIYKLVYPSLAPKDWTFFEFLFNPQKFGWLLDIFRQLTYWSQYPVLLNGLAGAGYSGNPLLYIGDVRNALNIIPFVVVTYLTVFVLIFKKLEEFRPLLLTCVISVVSIFFLNSYLGQYHTQISSSASRYLYFPTFLLIIFWCLFIRGFLWEGRKSILAVVFVGTFYLLNFWLINENFKWLLEWQAPAKAIWKYIAVERPKFQSNTLVLLPYPTMGAYEVAFANDQLGKGEISFESDSNGTVSLSDYSEVRKISYEKECSCVKDEKLKPFRDFW